MLLSILLIIFGIIALVKGEFKITSGRMVKGSTGRILGVVFLVAAAVGFIPNYGGGLEFLIFLVAVIVGISTAEKIQKAPAAVQPVDTKPLE